MASAPVSMLLADEHIDPLVATYLRKMGHDVALARSYSQSKAGDGHTDLKVLAFAKQEGRAVVTENWRDFLPLHRADPDHAGIIACKVYPDAKSQAKEIDRAIRAVLSSNGTLAGQWVRVPHEAEDLSEPAPMKRRRR
jgi:hypothetical protein